MNTSTFFFMVNVYLVMGTNQDLNKKHLEDSIEKCTKASGGATSMRGRFLLLMLSSADPTTLDTHYDRDVKCWVTCILQDLKIISPDTKDLDMKFLEPLFNGNNLEDPSVPTKNMFVGCSVNSAVKEAVDFCDRGFFYVRCLYKALKKASAN